MEVAYKKKLQLILLYVSIDIGLKLYTQIILYTNAKTHLLFVSLICF